MGEFHKYVTVVSGSAGLCIQSFIVAVNGIAWLKERSMTAADQIITSIGISRLFIHLATLFHMQIMVIEFKSLGYRMFVIFIDQAAIFSNICLSTLLSILYCVKISSFQHVLFLRLKTILSQRTIHLITAVVLLVFIYSLLMALFSFNPAGEVSKNSTEGVNVIYTYNYQVTYFQLPWNILIFLFLLVSSVLLIGFLWSHMNKTSDCRNIRGNMNSYIRIIKFTAFSFLILASITVLNIILYFEAKLDLSALIFICNGFPALHSVYLIYITTKLRSYFQGIVHLWPNRLSIRRGPESVSRDRVEMIAL